MLPVDRVIIVKRAILFHEALNLVQFYYAGSLKSYEADAKDERDAAIDGLYRAIAIVRVVDTQCVDWRRMHRRPRHRGGEDVNRLRFQRRAQIAGCRQIREFAPELVSEFEDARNWTVLELDTNLHDKGPGDLFCEVRREYEEYVRYKQTEAAGMHLYHARTLLKACKTAGTDAEIKEARIVATRLII